MFSVLFIAKSFFYTDLKFNRSYDVKQFTVLFNYFLKVKFLVLKLLYGYPLELLNMSFVFSFGEIAIIELKLEKCLLLPIPLL